MKRIALIFLILLSLFTTSCSVNYHVRKAFKKGYRCDTVNDTIKIISIDSFPVIVRDSIVWEKVLVKKDTIVRYNTSFVPKTRYQTRIEYKLKRDTLRMIEKVEVVKWKTDKNKNKKPNLWLFIIGFAIGFFAKFLMKFSKYNL